MYIAGLQKMTLLDFPGKVACTVFLPGCNFRCPFCHNGELLDGTFPPLMEDGELLAFLKSRRGLLDGVCITGGEPTLHRELPRLLADIKALGFSLKLDTNGSRPEVLRELISQGLVDYIAMDAKSDPLSYGRVVGLDAPPMESITESLLLLMNSSLPFELRTTVVRELHSPQSIQAMGQWLMELNKGEKLEALYLQPFADRETVLVSGLSAPGQEELASYVEILSNYAHNIQVRG